MGKPWVGWDLGSPSLCTLTSVTPSARTPVTESESHHCPQLEALQEQLRLLEEENEQLREEVRMGCCAQGGPEPDSTWSPSLKNTQAG